MGVLWRLKRKWFQQMGKYSPESLHGRPFLGTKDSAGKLAVSGHLEEETGHLLPCGKGSDGDTGVISNRANHAKGMSPQELCLSILQGSGVPRGPVTAPSLKNLFHREGIWGYTYTYS